MYFTGILNHNYIFIFIYTCLLKSCFSKICSILEPQKSLFVSMYRTILLVFNAMLVAIAKHNCVLPLEDTPHIS